MSQTASNLKNLEFVAVIDISGSMGTQDQNGGKLSRWNYAKEEALRLATESGQHDDDGITLITFNRSVTVLDNLTTASFADKTKDISPSGGTVLAPALRAALAKVEKAWHEKQGLIFVVCDGMPDDKEEAARVIVEYSKKMERDEQCAILFAQVGGDAGATDFLKYLDDDLVSKLGAKFDIVDTKPIDSFANKSIQDIVNEAFND